jgi:Zinc finger, C2H2 type
MYKCNECTRTFSRRSSFSNHIKTHAAGHIDEQMRIATEELKKHNEQEVRYSPVRDSPVRDSPIVEDIIDDINDQEHYDEVFDDEILGADIISDDKSNEVNNLFYLSFMMLY